MSYSPAAKRMLIRNTVNAANAEPHRMARTRTTGSRTSSRRGTPTTASSQIFQQPAAPSFGNPNPSVVNGTQQQRQPQQNGFGFGSQPNGGFNFGQTSNNPTSVFTGFGNGNNSGLNSQTNPPSAPSFSFNLGQSNGLSNPFAIQGTNQAAAPSTTPSMFNPFTNSQTSIFNAPSQSQSAPPPIDAKAQEKKLLDSPPQFASHAPFKWGEQDKPQDSQSASNPFSMLSNQSEPTASTGPLSSGFNQQPQAAPQAPSSIFSLPSASSNQSAPGQSTSNIFQVPGQQNSTGLFQNLGQSKQPATIQPTKSIFDSSSSQAPSQPSQSGSSIFSQTPFSKPFANDFFSLKQPQQPADSAGRNNDDMATSPDNTPKKATQNQSSPFTFSKPSEQTGSSETGTPGEGRSLFDRITVPEGHGLFGGLASQQNSDIVPPEGPDDSSTVQQTMGHTNPSVQATDPALSPLSTVPQFNKKPMFSQSSGFGASDNNPFANPPSWSNKTVGDDNPFSKVDNLKASRGLASPQSQSNPAQAKPAFESSNAGFQIKGAAGSSSYPPEAAGSNFAVRENQTEDPGHGSSVTPSFTDIYFDDLQRQQLSTGYRLKKLDMGLKKHILRAKNFFAEADDVLRFYLERKAAILEGAGTKRSAPEEDILKTLRSKKTKTLSSGMLDFSSSKKPSTNGASASEGVVRGGFGRPTSGNQQPAIGKRKADEQLTKDNADGAFVGGQKKSRSNDPVSYPTLPSDSPSSQTASIFKTILQKTGNDSDGSTAHAEQPSAPAEDHTSLFMPQFSMPGQGNATLGRTASSSSKQSSSPSKGSHNFLAQGSETPLSKTDSGSPYNKQASMFAQPSSHSDRASGSERIAKSPEKQDLTSPPKQPSMFQSSVTRNSASATCQKFAHGESDGTAATKSTSFKPPTFAGTTTNFMAQFGKQAEATELDNKRKHMEEDIDSDEDAEEWEQNYAEKQRAKKQKFEEIAKSAPKFGVDGKALSSAQEKGRDAVNSIDAADSNGDSSKAAGASIRPDFSRLKNGNSVFSSPFNAPSTSSQTKESANENIFGHLAGTDANYEESESSDEDEQDAGNTATDEAHNEAPRSERATTPPTKPVDEGLLTTTPKANPFSQSSASAQPAGKPVSETSPGGDQTFKQGSPIVFGGSNKTPSLSITSPSPSKSPSTLSGLFGASKGTTGDVPAKVASILGASSAGFSFGGPPKPAADPTPAGSAESKPAAGFNFRGAPKPVTDALLQSSSESKSLETPAKPASNIVSTTPTNPPSTFSFLSSVKPATDFLSARSVPASNNTSRATSPGATTGGESATEGSTDAANDGDLTAGEIYSRDERSGEEDEDILFEITKAKSMKWNGESRTWDTKGVGPLRVLKHRETGNTRVLMRHGTNGNIVLNSALISTVHYQQPQPKHVKLPVAEEPGKLATYMIKVAKDEDAKKLTETLEEHKTI